VLYTRTKSLPFLFMFPETPNAKSVNRDINS
jgi:hypothetical protein